MTVNDPILDLQILRPQSVKQHLPSKNLSLIFKHKPKKRKLFASQNNLVSALIYMKSINIYTQLFISKQGWILIFRSPTSKNSRNLAQQDFRRKGLWNVIVNLLFKPRNWFSSSESAVSIIIGICDRLRMTSHTP